MITIRGRTNPRFKAIGELLTPTKAAMEKVNDRVDVAFRRHERALFASEGTAGGPAWPPIPPDSPYGKWKKKHYPGRKVMQRKGDLRRSLTERDGLHVSRVYKITNWVGQWGTQDAKAKWHRDAPRRRDTLAHTDEQWRRYNVEVARALIPYVARAVRAFSAWRG